jgi:hypothetical protein
MKTTPILAFPDFSKEIMVGTDACETGIGAILSQEGHPIAYFSEGLSATNQKLLTYEKEFLAVDKWRSYLHKNLSSRLIIRAYAIFKIKHCQQICRRKQRGRW